MLSEKSRPVIEATAAVVAEHMPEITPLFYAHMFEAHPELLDGCLLYTSPSPRD